MMKTAIVGLSLIFGLVAVAPLIELPGAAQTLAPVSEIDRAIEEGFRLFQEGSAESLRKAIVQFERAQQLSQSAKVLDKQSLSLLALGRIYDLLGQKQEALKYFNQALPLFRATKDRSGEAGTLNNIGLVYFTLGEHQKALEYYNQALPIRRAVRDNRGEAGTLNNIGLVYFTLGEHQKALEYYNQALPIRRAVGDNRGEAGTLNNIGVVYQALGEQQKALESFNQALSLDRAVGDNRGEAGTLNNIGVVYQALDEQQKALEFFNQALTLMRAVGDISGEARTLNNIGRTYEILGEKQKALKYYNQALPLYRTVEDRSGEATTLNNIGLVYSALGEQQKALEFFNQALSLDRAVGDRSGEAITLNNIGAVFAAQIQLDLAISTLKQSVNVYESLRKDLHQLPKEQQRSYTETIARTYRDLANILLQRNRTIEALQVLDLLKVQEFQDFFKDVEGKPQDGTRIELLPQEQVILKAFEQRDNQSLNEFSQRSDIQVQLQDLKRNAVAQNLRLKTYLDLKTRVQKLGKNVALLYPLILDDRLELVVLTPDHPPIHKPVATTRKQLETQIQDFRRQLQERLPSIKQPAQQLYQKLLQPIEDELKAAGITTIVYSPDGMMRYVPLAALYDGKQWLIERYQINYLTALSLTPLDSPTSRQPSILAAAVTQPHTVNVLGNPYKFPELRFTKPEVEQLAKNLPTTSLIDRDFTRTNLTTGISTHNILHLATHGLFVPNSPDQSIILLGDGSTLSLREIEQQWKLPNVSLVVLSACETALGGNLGNGLEILGFGYQMQRIGSRATIASLWSVDDGGTQALMNSFYQNLQGNKTKAQALQQAQIALITQPEKQRAALEKRGIGVFPTPNTPQGARSLDHPYYWAPFILIGNGL